MSGNRMNASTVIPTDLITPLGAYLPAARDGAAAFLLESVEHGRLGPLLVRRLRRARSSRSRRPRRAASPASAISATTTSPDLEPTVALPGDGPWPPREPFRRRRPLVRFDHALGMAEVLGATRSS